MATRIYIKSENGMVMLTAAYKGKRFTYYTGVKVSCKLNSPLVPKTEKNARTKTMLLTRLFSEVETYLASHPDTPTVQVKSDIKAIVSGKPTNAIKTLVGYMEDYMTSKTNAGTVGVYQNTVNRLRNFDAAATFDTVNRKWLEAFEAHELCRGRTLNGISIDLRNIRTIFNWAIDNELTTAYPFRKFSIKTERKKHLTLNADELRLLRDCPVEPYQEAYRDLFFLGFYLIGINLADLLALPKSALRNGRITYNRQKTRRFYDIKVEPEAAAIIEKYKGNVHLLRFADDGCTSRTMCHNVNDALKRIGKMELVKNNRGAYVKKSVEPLFPDIVWYTARRSWATIAASLDIPKETIGKALGHSDWDSSTTDLYISFDHRKIDQANRMVLDWVHHRKNSDR